MRLAFVDLFFSWPPRGGGEVDVYHVARLLREAGHDVHLFVPRIERSGDRGCISEELPFPFTSIPFSRRDFTRECVAARVREAVDAYRPEGVFVCNGAYLKPYVLRALARYPLAVRLYAYEAVCIRDMMRFLNGAPCPLNYLETPNPCRRCALHYHGPQIRRWRFQPTTHEFVAGRAYMPEYHRVLREALAGCRTALVSNDLMRDPIAGLVPSVHVVPGGVTVSEFAYPPNAESSKTNKKIVLMCGRAEDPMKGLGLLREAGEFLGQDRDDFEIWATHPDLSQSHGRYRAVGWRTPGQMRELYQQADICVIPSLWEEPFGLVALEAMASGKPACAARVGGVQHIVRHGQTGFLFERGNAAALAQCLELLLDNPALCAEMGAAGRRIAAEEYDWGRVVAQYYPPILEELRA